MFNKLLFLSALALSPLAGAPAFAQEGFDCPTMCEQSARQIMEKCRANHPGDTTYCPADDGHILEDCRRTCAGLEGKSPEELQKMLPPDFKEILEGK